MIALRRILATALVLHGAIHMIGFAVNWELTETDGFPYSTEVIAGIDVGTSGIRIIGVLWVVATAAFVIAGWVVIRKKPWALTWTLGAAMFSSLLCLLQIDTAWRGLAIDLILVLSVVMWWSLRTHESHDHGVTR